MDQYHRAVLSAEEKFFDECDTGNGKIWFTMVYISIMIKLQSLLWLCSQSVMHYGLQVLQNSHQMRVNYLQKSSSWRSRSMQRRCREATLHGQGWKWDSIHQRIVCIWKVNVTLSVVTWFILFSIDMHNCDNGCQVLLERTAGVLDEEALQMLLITTQRSNMLLCIKYCVEMWVRKSIDNMNHQMLTPLQSATAIHY